MNTKILCIDDDTTFLAAMRFRLKELYVVKTASTLDEGLGLLKAETFDLVLLDVGLGNVNGIEAIGRIRTVHATVDIAMLSGQRDPKIVVQAIRAGAVDYLTKPFDVEELEAIVLRQKANRTVKERYNALVEAQNSDDFRTSIVHTSNVVADVLRQADRIKGTDANVVIVGETGTGKELLARYIHKMEENPTRPFIAVNCAAIPENLIEAELFGAEAGAYTGSVKRRIGKFELADGGDIFLDEIGTLKPELQAKILRILQEKEFCRVGGNDLIRANFRVISATNEALEARVSAGDFRMDLYHRLRVIQLTMPPLRERLEDIPALAEYFLARFSKGPFIKRLTQGATARLMAYHWPGNVRELANVIQSLAILSPREEIDESIFPTWALNGCGQTTLGAPVPLPGVEVSVGPLRTYIEKAERHYIEYALRACEGDKSQAAKLMDLGRTTLYGKMRELGMAI